MRPSRKARAAASRTTAGAGSEGWPTAIEMTGTPSAFNRLASAKTSIAWNGSTSPRFESETTIIPSILAVTQVRAAQMPD